MTTKVDAARPHEGYFYGPGWYRFGLLFWGTLFRRYCRLRVRGREHIPTHGPAVITANHLSMLDPFLVGYTLGNPHPIAFMAKLELFKIAPVGFLLKQWGAFPVDRAKRDAGSMRTALSILKAGEILGMFPEGTRSTTGDLQELRTGALRLAIRTNSPLIPVGIEGTDRSLPRHARFPKPAKITITFGPPLDLSAFANRRPTDAEIEHCSEALRANLEALHQEGKSPW